VPLKISSRSPAKTSENRVKRKWDRRVWNCCWRCW